MRGDSMNKIIPISIHALTRSATFIRFRIKTADIDFNPRTHEECDWSSVCMGAGLWYFNPRTHEECDNVRWYIE